MHTESSSFRSVNTDVLYAFQAPLFRILAHKGTHKVNPRLQRRASNPQINGVTIRRLTFCLLCNAFIYYSEIYDVNSSLDIFLPICHCPQKKQGYGSNSFRVVGLLFIFVAALFADCSEYLIFLPHVLSSPDILPACKCRLIISCSI